MNRFEGSSKKTICSAFIVCYEYTIYIII